MTLAVPARTDHLTEVLAALYPAPYGLRPEAGPTAAGYRLVPYRGRPRLLVPEPPRLAAAGLRCAAGRGPAARLGVRISTAIPAATRLLPVLRVYGPPDADCFGQYAGHALGLDDPHLVIHVGGPVRANRKPVVAVLDPDGRAAGYAKLGGTTLTQALVRNERAALRSLGSARLTYTRIPAVLATDVWYGHEVLIQSALPVSRQDRGDTGLLLRAMREVAQVCGVRRGRLADTGYWSTLRARIAHRYDHRLTAAATRLEHRAGDVVLDYGAWHGDWSPWNCQVGSDAVLVWDWERFAVGVPLGYDVLHHHLARALTGRRPAAALDDLARLLGPFGLTPQQARITAGLYLIEIATRYLTDGQRTAAAGTVMTLLERTTT